MKIFAWIPAVSVLVLATTSAAPQQIPTPEEFLGHEVGADYKLVVWPRIVEYFRELDGASNRISVRDIGETTEGRTMILAEISSAETVADLGSHRAEQAKVADPRTIANDEERGALIAESKVPILVNCQLHSNETAGSQMAIELAYTLVASEDPQVQEIRDRCIVLLVPCANPDGQVMVAEWYERSLGTPWEGAGGLPWLYQKYAGHDNNRDWFMLNLQETRNTTKVLYEEWFPTIVWDVHQMGNSNARLFVPPFHDPKNQNVHPVIDQTLLIIGGHMAGDLARNGRKGVVHSAIYDNWWAGGFRTTPYRHNMVGILTEAASVNGASPVFQRERELRGARRGLPEYEMSTNFPDPWPGGWWRLRDIVEYELDIAFSLFTLAARYHDRFQSNFIHMNEVAIDTGKTEPPFAWLVPPDQRDPGSARRMLERLHATAVEVHEATEPFSADGVEYPAGTFILYAAQPFRPHLMDMMERQEYPDRVMYPGGPAEPPYDMAGWTLPLQMGVRHVRIRGAFEAATRLLDEIPAVQGEIGEFSGTPPAWLVVPGHNDDYRLINRMHEAEIPFQLYDGLIGEPNRRSRDLPRDWIIGDDFAVPAGGIVIDAANMNRQQIEELLEGLSTSVAPVSEDERGMVRDADLMAAPKPRTALYQPWTASMDEGWTRLVLESFEFASTPLHNAEVQSGNLRDRYDCIVLPSTGARTILQGRPPNTTAPEYVGGIGESGVVALQEFVNAGGTLVCIDESTNFAIEAFNLPLYNVLDGKPSSEFYCPGSVLRLRIDPDHPLGYGMPKWYSGYFARSQAFQLGERPAENGEPVKNKNANGETIRLQDVSTRVVSSYSDTVLLESGWIRGGDLISAKPAIIEARYGDGNVVLIGFGVQRRGQPHGTFRILFNAIQRSTLRGAVPE